VDVLGQLALDDALQVHDVDRDRPPAQELDGLQPPAAGDQAALGRDHDRVQEADRFDGRGQRPEVAQGLAEPTPHPDAVERPLGRPPVIPAEVCRRVLSLLEQVQAGEVCGQFYLCDVPPQKHKKFKRVFFKFIERDSCRTAVPKKRWNELAICLTVAIRGGDSRFALGMQGTASQGAAVADPNEAMRAASIYGPSGPPDTDADLPDEEYMRWLETDYREMLDNL
jgi:hypothetical protein